MDAVDRFRQAARAQGLDPRVDRFPDGTRTAVDAAAAVGCDVGQIVKSLVFMADDEPVLVLTSGRNRVDTALVARTLAVGSVEQASPDAVREATGFAIGGTPPCGHRRPIRTLMDRDLADHDEVWAAAGTPDACFAISPDRLRAVTGARVVAVTEE